MSEELSAKKGEILTISLSSNPTTGFAWTAEFDPKFMRLIKKEFSPLANTVGAGGTERFEFKALKSGLTELRMIYQRGSEKENSKQKTYTMRIT